MRYMGSKNKLGKHILPIILKGRQEGQWYVEPFCGGCNTLSEVTGPRIGADSHYYLMQLWQAVSLGWLPPETITEDEYNILKFYKDRHMVGCPVTLARIGYIGFACSFGGRWFNGYARASERDLADEQYRSALKQFPKLIGVIFKHCSYEDLKIPENSIIYCDPPYSGTAGYGKDFNNHQFWEQAYNWVFDGHKVFVSEFNAPSGWVCVWSKDVTHSLRKGKIGESKTRTEKLFVHRSQIL